MAGRALLMVALAVAVSTVSMTEAATNHVVGGTTGWTIPSSASLYSQWAAGRAFAVGDTLCENLYLSSIVLCGQVISQCKCFI